MDKEPGAMQPTPGPWTTTTMHPNSVGPGPYPVYAHGEIIGYFYALEDAKQGAAAPALRDALSNWVAWHQQFCEQDCTVCAEARAALRGSQRRE